MRRRPSPTFVPGGQPPRNTYAVSQAPAAFMAIACQKCRRQRYAPPKASTEPHTTYVQYRPTQRHGSGTGAQHRRRDGYEESRLGRPPGRRILHPRQPGHHLRQGNGRKVRRPAPQAWTQAQGCHRRCRQACPYRQGCQGRRCSRSSCRVQEARTQAQSTACRRTNPL